LRILALLNVDSRLSRSMTAPASEPNPLTDLDAEED